MTPVDQNNEDMLHIRAMCDALRGLPDGPARGKHIIACIERHPRIYGYLRACYDPTRVYHINSKVWGGAKTKGHFEQETIIQRLKRFATEFAENPTANTQYRIGLWAHTVNELDGDAAQVACCILDKQLPGISFKLVQKVFEKMGKPPLPPQENAVREAAQEAIAAVREVAKTLSAPLRGHAIAIEFSDANDHHASADVTVEGIKAATVCWVPGAAMQAALAGLRAAGVAVVVPAHVKPSYKL
jgi:hypothetical protein